ncbi:MAG: hypothetical protein K2G44_03710 [Clostridia bacterium]|nr:hypothetical protein [Clostridia bacterium]
MEEKKNCKNCRYYHRHYIINKFGYYTGTCDGHCVNQYIPLRESDKRIKRGEPCDFWEPQILQKKERRENIEAVLRNMGERLTEIAEILKKDI